MFHCLVIKVVCLATACLLYHISFSLSSTFFKFFSKFFELFRISALTGADYKITWKTVTSSRFDSTAFKKAMPELAERFTKSTTSRRFIVA